MSDRERLLAYLEGMLDATPGGLTYNEIRWSVTPEDVMAISEVFMALKGAGTLVPVTDGAEIRYVLADGDAVVDAPSPLEVLDGMAMDIEMDRRTEGDGSVSALMLRTGSVRQEPCLPMMTLDDVRIRIRTDGGDRTISGWAMCGSETVGGGYSPWICLYPRGDMPPEVVDAIHRVNLGLVMLRIGSEDGVPMVCLSD